jgi:hypothetical protein
MEAPAEGAGSESVEGWFEKVRAALALSARAVHGKNRL